MNHLAVSVFVITIHSKVAYGQYQFQLETQSAFNSRENLILNSIIDVDMIEFTSFLEQWMARLNDKDASVVQSKTVENHMMAQDEMSKQMVSCHSGTLLMISIQIQQLLVSILIRAILVA